MEFFEKERIQDIEYWFKINKVLNEKASINLFSNTLLTLGDKLYKIFWKLISQILWLGYLYNLPGTVLENLI